MSGEALARRFHETYERLAPQFGYETRRETREFDPQSPNGRLMIAVCSELTTPSTPTTEQDGELLERHDWQWLADQLRAWPERRVHPERTMSFGSLTRMAADVIEHCAANPSPSLCRTSDSDIERVALALVNADQRRLDMPELTSVEEFRFDADRDGYLALARAALSTLSPSKIREEALDEAARVAEREFADAGWHSYYRSAARSIAQAIRSLTKGSDPAREEQR